MSNNINFEQDDKISVIMGIFNCADTLSAAIDSILSQTYSNWELIMCDDASTDYTYNIAKTYQEKYPDKIILVRNDVNSKLAFSLNHCLKYATGKYIARMDGDDMSAPERFEKQLMFMKSHTDVDLVGTAMQRFDGDKFVDVVKSFENPDKYTLRKHVPFHHATIMTYKYVYDALDGYTVSGRTVRAQDYDLWFRFYHAGFTGNNLPETLYFVRENLSAIKRRTFKHRWNSFKTTKYGFKLLNYPKWWILREFFMTLFKSLTPFWAVKIYRKFQSILNK